MAVTSVGGTYFHLQGLSTDDKPLDVQDGATFLIIDTGEMYVFHDGMWEQDMRQYQAQLALIGGI